MSEEYGRKHFEEVGSLILANVILTKKALHESTDGLIACFTQKQYNGYKEHVPEIFIDNEHIKYGGYIFKIEIFESPFENMDEKEFEEWFNNNKLRGKL